MGSKTGNGNIPGLFCIPSWDDFKSNPRHYARLSYQHETSFVGQSLEFVREDNFFLSFKRGDSDKMLFYNSFKGEYFIELSNKFSWGLNYEHKSDALWVA
ncbi:MAG: hypothetical protein IPN76_31255 [Saprospiraceae bacterium]|nr:hypothetical protein [Saprospiraceae bacterium]